jgi:hypothetical protein
MTAAITRDGSELPLYENAILLVDMPDAGLIVGDIGPLVDRHDVGIISTGYSVEFFGLQGNTVAIVTAPASALRCPAHGDRLVATTPEAAASAT